jgi:transcriptional regulator with XRE-family HTH domain
MKRRPGEIDKIIGKNLRRLRENDKMSRTPLCGILGVCCQQIEKYEKGKNRISCRSLKLLADFFGVSVEYFFERDEEEQT